MLKDVPVAPGAGHNLLRITRLLKMEYNVEGNKDGLQASKGNASVTLDCTIKAGIRYLLDIQLIPAMENECTRSKDEQNRNDEVGRAVAKAVPKTIDDKKLVCKWKQLVEKKAIWISKKKTMEKVTQLIKITQLATYKVQKYGMENTR